MPEQEKRFNYHIAACVEIDGENYVVDPLYNLEGENSGLSKFNDWVSFQNPIEGNTPDKKNRIISGYDSKGNVKENYKLLYFYEKNNQNKQLSPFEYAAKLLEYFSKNNNLEYDGGEIK